MDPWGYIFLREYRIEDKNPDIDKIWEHYWKVTRFFHSFIMGRIDFIRKFSSTKNNMPFSNSFIRTHPDILSGTSGKYFSLTFPPSHPLLLSLIPPSPFINTSIFLPSFFSYPATYTLFLGFYVNAYVFYFVSRKHFEVF